MPIPRSYFILKEALKIVRAKLPGEDAKAELVRALGSGQLRAWLVRDDTGHRVELPEHWWIVGDSAPPYFEWKWSSGWGKYDDERAVSGKGCAFGEIRVDGSALEELLTPAARGKGAQKGDRREAARAKCRRLIRQWAAKGKRMPKKLCRHTAMAKVPDLSGRDFDAVWSDEAPKEWKQAGRLRQTLRNKPSVDRDGGQ